MRLVCPNCAAQYNVDDRAIPPGGRDVQCSNCGHTWFQTGLGSGDRPRVRPAGTVATAGQPPAPSDADAPADWPEPDPWPEVTVPDAPDGADTPDADWRDPEPQDSPAAPARVASGPGPDAPAAEPAVPAPAASRSLPVLHDDGDWEDDEPADHLPDARSLAVGPAPQPPGGEAPVQGRRVLDEAVLAILREEAEREARARRADAQGVETQAELGLPAPVPAPASRRAITADAPPLPAEPPPDTLPDAAGISSSLSAPDGDATPADVRPATGRTGFAAGFAGMLALGGLALALYLLAPQIGAAVPALAEPIAAYVDAADAARRWLSAALAGVTGG